MQIIVPYSFSIDVDSTGVSIIKFSDKLYLHNMKADVDQPGGGMDEPDDGSSADPAFEPDTDTDGQSSEGTLQTGDGDIAGLDCGVREPILFIRCAVSVRDPDTRQPVRYERQRELNSNTDTEPLAIIHPEIVRSINQSNGTSEDDPEGHDNQTDVDKECDYYLDGLEKTFRLEAPEDAPFIGILDVDLDGAVQVIEWSIDGQDGPTTRVSRNHDDGTPVTFPYRQRVHQRIQQAADRSKISRLVGLFSTQNWRVEFYYKKRAINIK